MNIRDHGANENNNNKKTKKKKKKKKTTKKNNKTKKQQQKNNNNNNKKKNNNKNKQQKKKKKKKTETEDHWSCIAHLSAEDMLKSAVIEKKNWRILNLSDLDQGQWMTLTFGIHKALT